MKKLAIFLIGLIGCLGILSAQEVISSAGETFSNGEYKISWTLGEPVIETVSNGNNILTQGFHQTNLSATPIEELKLPGLKLKVYPNPTDYVLNIQSEYIRDVKLQYSLFDANGKTLLNKKFIKNPAEVNMTRYAAGNYLLSITTTDGKTVQQFKIIKR